MNLGESQSRLELSIVDNGLGIAPKAGNKAGHLGITGVLERANSIGVTVIVCPAVAGGTLFCLSWTQAA